MSGTRHNLRPTVRLTAEQEPFLPVRSLATNYASGFRIEPHQHPWHQFLYAVSGAMTVSTGRSSWMIPTGRAVFIPAGCAHAIRMWGTVEMRTLHLSPALTVFPKPECRVVELMRQMIDAGFGDRLMLGGDFARRSYLKSYGGGPGYDYLLTWFTPRLLEEGFPQAELRAVWRDNPIRWLTSGKK